MIKNTQTNLPECFQDFCHHCGGVMSSWPPPVIGLKSMGVFCCRQCAEWYEESLK